MSDKAANKAEVISLYQISCVQRAYLEEVCKKQCEITSSYTLADLYDFILEKFKFDDDHMHNFFIGGRSHRSTQDIEEGEEENITLSSIFPLEKNHNLFMRFDYGDDWLFKISRTRAGMKIDSSKKYPRVVKTIGKNPEQYPLYDEE